MITIKRLATVLAVFIAIIILPAVGLTEVTTNVTPLSTLTAEQMATLNRLYAEIATLQAKLNELKAQATGIQTELQLTKQWSKGSRHDEIKTLQRLLSTDTEIYPEGVITGYYGPLTEKAVRKMQKKAGLPETGQLDSQTISRINEILKNGAGKSGKIPPGLLHAPGIWKKMGTTTCPNGYDCDDDNDDDGDDDGDDRGDKDKTAPVITSKSVSNITTSSAVVTWLTNEMTTGKVHYALTTPVVGQGGGLVQFDNTLGTTSSVNLSGLTASTTYYYYIKTQDQSGNSVTTPDASFMTSN
ncbi:MAG: peptidoglycan-binding protein [Patescibacteria group bacterium]